MSLSDSTDIYFNYNICKKRCSRQPVVKYSKCLKFLHFNYTQLTKQQLSPHCKSNEMYICLNCVNDALPFQQLQNAEFRKLFYDYSKIALRKEFDSINKDLS